MLYRNNFPEFLEAISIGPNPEFLEKNTTFCEFVSAFPQEVELMYDWKKVKRSSDPLNALRDFTKKFVIYGPDLDVQTLKFFVKKVNVYPQYYGDTVKNELDSSFEIAKTIYNPRTYTTFITTNTALDKDNSFLHKLAELLKSCKKPCNYFKPTSASLGTLADFGKALSDAANVLAAAGSDLMHAPTNIATDICNKTKPMVRTEFFKLKILTQDLYRDGVKPFFSDKDRERVKDKMSQGLTPDKTFDRLPLTNDSETYFRSAQSYSDLQAKLRENLGDCYRIYDYNQRYNPYDPTMNVSFAKRKYMGVKNGNVKSLVDIFGSLAPSQYASENTYFNALDVPKDTDFMRYDDSISAPKYDTYDGPSKGSEQVITGGSGATANPVEATGSQTSPTNGKVYEFNYGEVKLTSYGYIKDECPDSGTEIGLGNAGNMIIPLKTIAVAPESIDSGMVKKGDVLIITCTDKGGNTWIERRQVGDQSGPNLLHKGGNYKFLIDEFQPDKKQFPSKIAGRTNELKLKIQIADTKEPLAKWNPQQASQYAPMFLCRTDWERVKKQGRSSYKSYVDKMDSEYIQYVKWDANEPLDQNIINKKSC